MIRKRVLDVVLTVIALVLLAPIIAVVALAVRLRLGSPVIFRQARPGRQERLFTLIKFRTMVSAPDAGPLNDDQRMTPLGSLLRSTSLDELPELWNVLRGEMSIVGPRPLLPEYLPLYTPEQRHRHDMRPGLTGWSQINGRNATTWEEQFAFDVWYVEHWSIGLDLKIIWRTIMVVLSRQGISQDGEVTRRPFTGSTQNTAGDFADQRDA